MGETVRVLVYSADEGGQTAQILERTNSINAVTRTNPDDVISELLSEPVDCLLTLHEPEFDGMEILKRVRAVQPQLPVVLFTDVGSERLVNHAFAHGISEYVRKTGREDDYVELADRIHSVTTQPSQPPIGRIVTSTELPERRKDIDTILDISLQRLAGANFVGLGLIQKDSFIYANEELASMFGYTREDLLTEITVADIVHDDDEERVLGALRQREWDLVDEPLGTFRGRRKDGESVHIEIHDDRVLNSDPPTIIGLFHDVTERKRRESELERYETMVNTAGDIVYALDRTGRFTFINDSVESLTGYTRGDLLGEHVSVVLNENDAEKGRQRIRNLLESDSQRPRETYRIGIQTKDGETISCQTQITLLEDEGEFCGSVGVVREISDRLELEALLRTERDQFAALFENITEPTVRYEMSDGTPHATAVNGAFEEVFGYAEESVVDRSIDEIIIPLGRETQAKEINERVLDGEPLDIEVCRQTTDGLREFRLTNVPISTSGETVTGYAIYTDITDMKRREYQLERQKERLEEFASVVSHDLRQPLGIVQGRLDIIREEYTSHHLDDIEDAVSRMNTLIENVLRLARQGRTVSTPQPVSLDEVVRDGWEIAGGDEATLTIDGQLGTISADGQRLQGLFENLFRNAIEHGGKDVSVTVGRTDSEGFFVEDDGQGIPPESRDQVFEHGYSTGEDGTGLGLAIVRAIVEAHGWSISLTSSENGGARFEIDGLRHALVNGE